MRKEARQAKFHDYRIKSGRGKLPTAGGEIHPESVAGDGSAPFSIARWAWSSADVVAIWPNFNLNWSKR
jgi:hypothetical protein